VNNNSFKNFKRNKKKNVWVAKRADTVKY